VPPQNDDRWQARVEAVQKAIKSLRRWAVRVAAFYFGYKILHREIYEVDHVDPLLLALGLWLCGIAPADVFDGLRRIGDQVGKNIDKATGVDELDEARKPQEPANGESAA
jgi:hypothetical protein